MDMLLTTIVTFWYTVAVVFIVSRFLYYPNNGKKEFLFTYIMLAAVIFIICRLVSRVELGLGFAIGIFAIFGIIRYRTIPIAPREMTYIFVCAGIAAKSALVNIDLKVIIILTTDFSLIILIGLSEYFLFRKKLLSKIIVYDNLELIHPDKRKELFTDLDSRYGITDIEKIKVGKIDSFKNSARLLITFKDRGENHFLDD